MPQDYEAEFDSLLTKTAKDPDYSSEFDSLSKPKDEFGIGEEVRGIWKGILRGAHRWVQSVDIQDLKESTSIGDNNKKIEAAQKELDDYEANPTKNRWRNESWANQQADRIAILKAERDRIVDIAPTAAKSFTERQEKIENLPRTQAQEEFSSPETPWWSFFKNPVELTAVTTAESIPVMAESLPGAIAGPAGLAVSSGAASHTAESSARIINSMSRDGVDLKDPESVLAWFNNTAKAEPAIAKANLAALGPATFDSLTAGYAGSFLRGALGRGIKPVVSATAKEVGMQMAGGGAGSIAGNLLAQEPIDWKDVVLEMAAEIAPVESVTNVRKDIGARKQRYDDLRLTRQVRDSVRELQRRQGQPSVVPGPEAGTVRTVPVPSTEADVTALNTAGTVTPVDQFVAQNRPSRPPAVPAPPAVPPPVPEPDSTLPGLGLVNLVPVLETPDGKLYPGMTHADALAAATQSLQRGEITPEQFSAAMEAQTVDSQHKFLDVNTGQVLNREQAGQVVGLNAPLDSENLPTQYKEQNLPAARMVSVMTPAERNDYFEHRRSNKAQAPAVSVQAPAPVVEEEQVQGVPANTQGVRLSSPPSRTQPQVRSVAVAEPSEEFNWLTGISATGKSGIVELLSNDKIQLDPEIRQMGLVMLSFIDAKYLDRLTFSVDANGMAGGEFIPWMNMARVAMNSTDPQVAAHEIAHYLANFLTSKERGEMAAARAAEIAIARTDKSNSEFFAWLDANGGSATSAEYTKWKTGTDIDPRTIASLGTPFRFATSTEIALRTPRPFGLTPDKNGFIAKNSLLAKMKNQVAKEELDALKPILDSLPDRVSAALLANRIQEQGPQLEVVKLDANAGPSLTQTPESIELNMLRHTWFDTLPFNIKELIGKYQREHIEDPESLDSKSWINQISDDITDVIPDRAAFFSNLDRYVYLNEEVGNFPGTFEEAESSDSATFNYQFVNPKPLKDMPGAVDILVRIPHQDVSHIGYGQKLDENISFRDSVKFRGGHFGSSDRNVVGWVRAYIETLPNGERVFHVFEVQSDWAQRARDEAERGGFPTHQDPLLAYYESAALKAAIRHARELGITKVAVSDANTAMLTEGHDRQSGVISSHATEQEAKEATEGNPDLYVSRATNSRLSAWYVKTKTPIKQESGMRLHYDQTLPNIMRKLTGSDPVLVDFGVHQNAYPVKNLEPNALGLTPLPREDLIFKNPDGTLKTTVTARVFDISGIDTEVPAQMYRSSLYSLTDPLYHLINDDEFFAHYMSEAARGAVPAELRTIIDKVRDIILRILEAIKEWAGANPDYWQELMRKFERGHFLVHENGGMLYERNNRSKASSLPPIKGLPAMRQYTGVDQGQEEAALIRTLTYEQNQPLVAHAADLFRLLSREVRSELPGVASRLAALVETQRQGGAVGQTPLKHYAVLVNALALQEEGRTLSGEIEKIVEDIQKQAKSKDKAGMAEIVAKQLEAIAQQSISDYKNFQISEKNKDRAGGIAEAINREIKFLDSLRDSTDPLRRAIEIISESVTLEQLNDPNASTQSIVDIAKKRIVELTGAATWQQATIPAGSGKAGVPNDQLRIAVAVLQENQRLVQDLITYKELSDPAFARIMREGEAEFDKHIASLTYRELRSFLKTYHSVRSAKDRARQIYIKHRARMKDLIERLEVKVQADDFLQAQVIGSVQFKTALRDATQFDFMSADLFKDGNGNHVLRRTYYNPLNKEESIDIVDGTTKESYEKNVEAYEQVATWFEDANQDENIDELDKRRISFELGRIYYEEIIKEYDEQGGRMVYKPRREYNPESGKRTAGPFNISNILANLTGNSLQYAMQKIGGRASVQLGSIAQTRSEAIRRTSEVRHDMTVPLQTYVIDAAKDHSMELSRWQEEIAEPVLSSYNSIGAKQIKAGDTTRFGHKVTGKDMVAVRNMKSMADAMSKAGIEIDTISAKNHPVRIKETIFGREITRLQQGGTELIVPRRFRKRFIKMLEDWHEIKRNKIHDQYLKDLIQHVQSGPVFDNLVVAHIYSTQRYPDYANVTRFKQAYREIYNQILDSRPPSSFSEVVEIVFQNQTGLDPALQLTREDIAKEIITKEIDAMARKVVDQDVKNRAGDTPGTQVRIDSADNFLTKPRGQMIAPDVGYQYSIINKEDIKWLSRSVIEVHEQMARDGLMKIKKILEDYVVEWKDRAKHPEAQKESIRKQISGEDWMNYREARQMLNQINRLIDKTSPEAFNSFIDEQFGGIGRRVWSILIQSLLQSATVLKNNLFGMNLALWQMEVQWRGDGVWMGMPKWLLKLPTMAKNGIAWPMRDTVAFVVGGHAYRRTIKKGVSIDVKGTKFYGEDALRIAAANPNLAKAVTAQVGGFLLKRAINIQRARDLGAAGPYGLKDQVSRYLTMHLRGGEIENLDQTTAENIKGSVASLLGLFQETGVFVAFPVMLPKAAAPRKLEHLLNFQAQRHADRLLEELTLDLKEALRDRKENGISSQPVTDAELLGDSTAKQGEALYLRRMFSRAGINLEVAIQRLTTRESSFDLLTPPEWNSFVLEVQKEMNMPSADNRVIFRSGFGRLMSSLMGYGFWYNERAADVMARDSRKQFDLAALYRGMFFFGVIVAMGVLVGTPIQRWLKRFFYNEEDQTGHFSSDNTAWRNIGVLWEQTAPFWPIIGSVMSQLYDARTGGGKLFNFLPVSVATQALQSANEIGQTGNVFYPTVKLLRQWLPNTKIILNRIPETEGLMEVNSAGRILRSTAAGDVEVRTQKTGGAIKYSPVSTETQMAVNEMAKSDPDYESIKHYRDEAVRKLIRRGASRQDAERRFDLAVLARYPENTVFGRPLTLEERSRQQSRMGADQIARLSQVEDSFDRYASTFGLRAPSRLRQPRTRGQASTGLSLAGIGRIRRRRSGRNRLVRNRSLTRGRRTRRLIRM